MLSHLTQILLCLTYDHVHIEDLLLHQQKLLSPTENTDPKTPRLWSCLHTESTFVGSGMCELTNQSRLGIRGGGGA